MTKRSTGLHGLFPAPLRVLGLALGLGVGCVIDSDGGDDDGAGDDGGGTADDGGGTADDGGGTDDGAADDGTGGASDDGPADESGGGDGADDGAAGGPSPGAWLYEETGGTTNDCAFLDATNGYGEFTIGAGDAGTFTIVPGDGTAPFECMHDGATFQCAERLQGTEEAGGTSLQVLVSASGDLVSDSEVEGTQDGRVVCEGADCAAAEKLLATTFPCEFSIPWRGTKV